jgi:glycine cleavage system H protein
MAKPLVFMMGQSPAFLPVDRLYARNHMWAMVVGGRTRFGLSAYAVRLLGEFRHVEWSVRPGDLLARGKPLGYVEASKATSDLFAPAAGRVVAVNDAVAASPVLINTDLYDRGWLFDLEGESPDLLTPEAYLAHVEASWPIAQRMLKGQTPSL